MKQKEKIDLIYSYLAFGITALAALATNFLASKIVGLDALGVYSLSLSFYLVLSQVATFGVHHSVLQKVASRQNDKELGDILSSAVCLLLIIPTCLALLLYLTSPLYVSFFSDKLEASLIPIFLALPAFSFNKLITTFLNGLRNIKAMSAIQGGRGLLMLVLLPIFGLKFPDKPLTTILLLTELALLMLSIFLMYKYDFLNFLFEKWKFEMIKGHLQFGSKGALSSILVDLNTRVDILMLGLFVSESAIGIYTLAASVAEGVYQMLVVLRNNLNPRLAEALKSSKTQAVEIYLQNRAKIFLSTLAMSLLAFLAFKILLLALGLSDSDQRVALSLFGILGTGITLVSYKVPFDWLLLLGDMPLRHTFYISSVAGLNLILNPILISHYGVYGAAMATALSMIIGMKICFKMIRTHLAVYI